MIFAAPLLPLLLSPAAAAKLSLQGAPPPSGFDYVGNGFCVDAQQRRPGVWLCFGGSCGRYTPTSCGKLCGGDPSCAALDHRKIDRAISLQLPGNSATTRDNSGFMIQDMAMYKLPPACSLVTTRRPSAAGSWQWGAGPGTYEIAGHDAETRDSCYKKHGGVPPGPPPPSPPPPPGKCPDGTDCGSYTCCKLREPFGYGCAGAGGAVCCPDHVHYCLAGYVCNMSTAPPPSGHVGAWGETGAWHCSKKTGVEGVSERRRAAALAAIPPQSQQSAPISSGDDIDNCHGKQQPWQTWPSLPPATHCPPGDPGDQRCSPYELSNDISGVQFNHCQGFSSGSYSFGKSQWDSDFPELDLNGGGSSDTWYPWWSADGRWYSSFTDGSVGGIHSQSGGAAPSMHGQVVLEPAGGRGGARGDVSKLRVVQAATFALNATPFAGNYPTGVFTSNASGKEIWYYGTYPVLGGNTSKWNEDCTNWCSLGPFPGWLWSDDSGQHWHNSGHFPQGRPAFNISGPDGKPLTPAGDFHTAGGVVFGGLFGECAGHHVAQGNTFVEPCAVKFAYPRPVDYGQNNLHSPDGKLYFTSMGSSRADGPVSWMSADEVHMARADPSLGPISINDRSSYEFYAGEDSNGRAQWSKQFLDAKPLFKWWNQTGITACTYLPKLQKMLCTIETTGIASGVNTQFDFDTYILEASAPDGHFPAGSKFKLVTYMRSFGPEAYFVHVPSRFAPDLTGGSDNGIGYMAMAANFAEGIVPSEGGCGCSHCTVYNECQMGGIMHPTGGIYGMNLQKIRLCGPALNISCKTPPRLTLDKERKWVPPKLRDFERSAVASGHFPGAVDVASHPSTAQTGRGRETPIYMGVDVDSNTPRVAPPANFSSCMSNSKSCSPALLEEWAKLDDVQKLPARPDIWVGLLWEQLVGNASFDASASFFLPPPNNTFIQPPSCAGLSRCVRVLGFRGKDQTTTVVVFVNLDSNRTYIDKGDTGRDLYYLHRKEWRFTVPSINSTVVSLNGKVLQASSDALQPSTPLALAGNAAKATLTAPPLSITFWQFGLLPALSSP